MKKTIFKLSLLIGIFLFFSSSSYSQVKVKTRDNYIKRNKINKRAYNKRNIVKRNRNRVILRRPNRPRVIIKRPNILKPGYIWVEGYWEWNSYFDRYVWQRARWKRTKKGHHWVVGCWKETPNGFFWVKGYWDPY